MINFLGKRITEAEPSTPVEVTGLSEVPNAGDTFIVTDTDKEAKNFAGKLIKKKFVKKC